MTSTHKRKQFWVDAPLQLQMLAFVLALVAASLLLVSFSIVRGLTQASAESRVIFHSLDWVKQTIRGPLTVASVLSILASALLTLIWSHRFAGPLRVLSAGMGRLKTGNFTVHTKVRDTDTLQDTVKEFAQMQDGLKHLLHDDKKKVESAAARLRDLADSLDGEKRRQLLDVAETLKGVGARFHL